MKIAWLLILTNSVILLHSCSSGQDKEFTKIQYASFDVNSYRTHQKNTPLILLYAEIAPNGQIHFNDSDPYDSQFKYGVDNLSSPQIDSLKSIFNDKEKLNSHLKEYQFKTGEELYSGSYDYYVVTYKNGISDTLCTILPFMDTVLGNVHEMLLDKIYFSSSKQKDIDSVKPTSIYINSLFNAFKINKLLPPIQNPPSFRLEDNPQLKQN